MGTAHRQEVTDVFYFDQLSDEAKEKARDWWRDLEASDPSWTGENRQSIEAFEKAFEIKTDWEYDAWSYQTTTRQGSIDDTIWELSGVRLAAYFWNHHQWLLVERKSYGKRKSRIVLEQTSCPLTGYCMDDTLLDPIRAHIKNPKPDRNFGDVMTDCVDAWGRACRDDLRGQQEDEQVDEAIISNEYEFDVTGNRV